MERCSICGIEIPKEQLICGMCPACYKKWLEQKQRERTR